MLTPRLFFLALFLSMMAMLHGAEKKPKDDKDFNPETILIGHFSLHRPANWQWMHTEKGQRAQTEITFHVTESPGAERHATVLFNLFAAGEDHALPANVARRWKTWFEGVEELPSEKIKIGEHQVTFVEYTGAYRGPTSNKKARTSPNYRLYGVVIEDDGGNVVGRFYGPTDLVKRYKSDFRKAVEDAVKQD